MTMMRSLLSSTARTALRSAAKSSSSSSSFIAPSLLSSPTSASLLRRHLSSESRAKIDAAVKSTPLVLFMKGTPDLPQCGFSRAVCQILEVQGVKKDVMKTFNILEDQELREGIKEYSSWPTIPQVYIDGEFIGGCDIVLSMHQNGELETLLMEKKLVDDVAPAVEV